MSSLPCYNLDLIAILMCSDAVYVDVPSKDIPAFRDNPFAFVGEKTGMSNGVYIVPAKAYDAAIRPWQEVTSMYEGCKSAHPQPSRCIPIPGAHILRWP